MVGMHSKLGRMTKKRKEGMKEGRKTNKAL
jgi:hypothetical protein